MSKSSAKERYVQLKEWLEVRGQKSSGPSQRTQPKFSKADYYKGIK